jgi:hypothetical protein
MSRHWARRNAKLGRAERCRGELTSVCRAGDGERGARLIHGNASESGLFSKRSLQAERAVMCPPRGEL